MGLAFHTGVFRRARFHPSPQTGCKTLKKEGRAFRNIGSNKRLCIPDCKISLAFFVLYFHLLLIRSFIRIRDRSFVFVSWSLLKKLNLLKTLAWEAIMDLDGLFQTSKDWGFYMYTLSFL